MSYKLLIFIAIVALAHQQYTDITMLNCPAQFDISKYNSTTDSTVADMGSFIYAGFQSEANKDRVVEIVTTGDYQKLN